MTERTFRRAQIYTTLGMALLIALPFLLYTFRIEYQGLVPFRTNDDGAYISRIHTASLGRFDEVDNGITGGQYPNMGAPPVLLEKMSGALLSWTGMHGPQIAILLVILIAPLIIPLTAALLRQIGISRALSLTGALVYAFVFLSPLQRPVNMSWSLPLSMSALLLLCMVWKKPSVSYVFSTAIVLGLLPFVFFWSWTFVWTAGVWLFVIYLVSTPQSDKKRDEMYSLIVIALLGLVVGLPFLFDLIIKSTMHPHFAETALRSQIIPSFGVESIPRSILLTLLALLSLVLMLGSEKKIRAKMVFPLAMVLSAFSVMHQNFIHGKIFTFSSHYYPFVCLAALVMGMFVLQHVKKSYLKTIIVSIAGVFLIAGVWDYRMAWSLPFASAEHLSFQHLRAPLAHLTDGKRENVLTDMRTAQMITSWTDDDTVFTPYTRHLLISNREFAERYCMSELPSPEGPDINWIAWEAVQIRLQDMLPEREKEFKKYCDILFYDKEMALRKYEVDLLLWNEHERSDWIIDKKLFTKTQEGDGWSLWAVK